MRRFIAPLSLLIGLLTLISLTPSLIHAQEGGPIFLPIVTGSSTQVDESPEATALDEPEDPSTFDEVQAANTRPNFSCQDGGGSGGVNGYKSSSDCASKISSSCSGNPYSDCDHSDFPGGPEDTVYYTYTPPAATPIAPNPNNNKETGSNSNSPGRYWQCDDGGGSQGVAGFKAGSDCESKYKFYCLHPTRPFAPCGHSDYSFGSSKDAIWHKDDADGDGVDVNRDNCDLNPNPQQHDFDNDYIGNVCDDELNLELASNPSGFLVRHEDDGTKQLPGETCYNSSDQSYNHKVTERQYGSATVPVAEVRAGFRFCADGNIVYGSGSNVNGPPDFSGSITGLRIIDQLATIVPALEFQCGPIRITGSGYEPWQGYSKGKYAVDFRADCEAVALGNYEPLKVPDYTIRATAKAIADGGSVLLPRIADGGSVFSPR